MCQRRLTAAGIPGFVSAVARRERPTSTRGPRAPLDRPRAEDAVRSFLEALGLSLSDPELRGTPGRVVTAWSEVLLEGYGLDPVEALGETLPLSSTDRASSVVVTGIPLLSMCPHHLLPLHGSASLAYLPRRKLAGFGRLAGFVDACAHRLVLQEDLTRSIAMHLERALEARAVAVRLEAQHFCVAVTEPAKQGARFITTALAGQGRAAQALLAEIHAALGEPATTRGARRRIAPPAPRSPRAARKR